MPWLVNASRIRLRARNRAFASQIPYGAMVLDAGAGDAPYADLFSHTLYETADFNARAAITHVCDLQQIPVEDERYDCIICNQVLEHVPSPDVVLRELFRVLKTDGKLLCTCPLYYEEHQQPYDFFRYTQFGLRRLFSDAGLEILELDWLEGYFGTVAYQCDLLYRSLPKSVSRLRCAKLGVQWLPLIIALKAAAFLLAGVLYRLEMRVKWTASGHPKNYLVIARKRNC